MNSGDCKKPLFSLAIRLCALLLLALPVIGHAKKADYITFINVGDSDIFLAVKTGTDNCKQEGEEKQMVLESEEEYSVDADFACYGYGTDKQHTTDWKKADGRGVYELTVD